VSKVKPAVTVPVSVSVTTVDVSNVWSLPLVLPAPARIWQLTPVLDDQEVEPQSVLPTETVRLTSYRAKLSPETDTKPPPVDAWFPLEKDDISGPSYVTTEFKHPTADATVIDKATDLPVPAYPMQADEVVDIQDAEEQGRPLTAMVVVAE
jgi:hypothetical protein